MNDLGITNIMGVNAAAWGIGSVLVDVGTVVLNQSETLLGSCWDEIGVLMGERIRHYFCSLLWKPTERNRDIITTRSVYFLVYLQKLTRGNMCLCTWRYSEYSVSRNGRLVVVVE